MARFISITKAASLANVHAKEIQQKIKSKELSSSRGQIYIEELIECYPHIRMEDADIHSMVKKIKDQSFDIGAHKQFEQMTISELTVSLKKFQTNVDYYKEQTKKYEHLVQHLINHLKDLEEHIEDNQRVHVILHWIEHRLSEIQRNE